jgi:nitrilase
MKVALLQTNSIADKAANLAAVSGLVARAMATASHDLLLLPEMWDFLGGSVAERIAAGETFPDGPAYSLCARLAREHRVWLHAGSIRERVPGEPRVFNTSVVFDRSGREVARYRKIHLFDVTLPDGVAHNESASIRAGDRVVAYDLEGTTVGCAICYDLRFPELFRRLAEAGAKVIALPSAFTLQTGRDHWEVLCRARAIETQAYLLACGQWGPHRVGEQTRHSYGRSLVVDPWGTVLAQAPDGVGVVEARLDMGRVDEVRSRIPVASHRVLA